MFPSARAAAHTTLEDLESDKVQTEWSVSTFGLLGVLLFWSAKRHLRAERANAEAMLRAFVMQMKVEGVEADMVSLHAPLVAPFRTTGLVENGMCCHLTGVLNARSSGDDAAFALVNFARNLNARAEECLACKNLLQTLLRHTERKIHDHLSDPDAFAMDMEKMTHVTFKKRKLRADADYEKQIIEEQVKRKCTHNGRQGLRANGEFHPSTAQGWEREHLRGYIVVGWRVCSGPGTFFITEDAARWGQPPEDTEIYSCWSGRERRGAFLPPQVCAM